MSIKNDGENSTGIPNNEHLFSRWDPTSYK